MNKLFLLFLAESVTTTEDTLNATEEIKQTTNFFDTKSLIIWYSVFALSIALLVLYFVSRHNHHKRFNRLQIKLGKEYTKMSTIKNPLSRIPKVFSLVETILVDVDIIKEKTSLSECDEALSLCKKLIDKMRKPELTKEEETKAFIEDVAKLNSLLAQIYTLTSSK